MKLERTLEQYKGNKLWVKVTERTKRKIETEKEINKIWWQQ
jgi:hypothetical protein